MNHKRLQCTMEWVPRLNETRWIRCQDFRIHWMNYSMRTTATLQATTTENQLSGFFSSLVCHPFLLVVSCMKKCESTELQTLVEKQKNNGTICVLMFTFSRNSKSTLFTPRCNCGGQLLSLTHVLVPPVNCLPYLNFLFCASLLYVAVLAA